MEARYFICWYDKDTDALIGEIEAVSVPFADLQKIFTLPRDEGLLYESQLIDHHQAQRLSTWIPLLSIPLLSDFDQYIYQLDCFPL